jgi:hypothetical protein
LDSNYVGLLGNVNAINIIESILRIFSYVAFIGLSFKAVQALNIYINKNANRQ